jgi:hypothetical protein
MAHKIRPTLTTLLPILSVFFLAAIAYLPYAHQFGYYNDDWYLIYSGVSQGSEVFQDIFAIDRPFRGYFVGWMFDLFGVNATLYSYSAYVLRCLGALGVMWIVYIVWPKERMAGFILALICVVYPGFLDQPNAIDFQSHIWAFSLAIGSIAFSLQAMKGYLAGWQRITWLLLAVVSQLIALLLMEYYIGLEGLRLLLMMVMVRHLGLDERRQQLRKLAGSWLPSLAGLAGFMAWRQLVFENQRGATDISVMLSELMNSPLLEGAWMVVRMLQDLLNVILIAWAVPLYTLAFNLRLKQVLPVISLALLAAGVGWAAMFFQDRWLGKNKEAVERASQETSMEMALVGFLGVAASLLPVHLGDRQVIFDYFSRFTLTGSIGAGLILVAFWRSFLAASRLRVWFPITLLGLGVMTHAANSVHHVDRWQVMRNFWWQVSWRVPQIEPGTILMADYAGYGIAEDYFVWGPANLIYETSTIGETAGLPILAATLDKRDLIKVLGQEKEINDRRSIISEKDFANLLILSMANPASCVHALDGDGEVSNLERIEMIALAPFSHIDRIQAQESPRIPPAAIFGAEPAHGWCYYYQKAALARQRGNWEEIVRLGSEAHAQDLRPYDWIEWLPFVQAYAYTGYFEEMKELTPIVRAIPYLNRQACQIAQEDPYQAAELYPIGYQELINEFCLTGLEVPP